MRGNRTYGSEGGAAETSRPSLGLEDVRKALTAPVAHGASHDRGRDGRLVSAAPPSEPYVRFSRIRLSGQ
jgi:hypothetical protein